MLPKPHLAQFLTIPTSSVTGYWEEEISTLLPTLVPQVSVESKEIAAQPHFFQLLSTARQLIMLCSMCMEFAGVTLLTPIDPAVSQEP